MDFTSKSHTLGTPQEVLHQIVGRHGAPGLQHGAPVARRGRAAEQTGDIELLEEVLGDHLVPEVGVVGRRVARQVSKGSIKMSARQQHRMAVVTRVSDSVTLSRILKVSRLNESISFRALVRDAFVLVLSAMLCRQLTAYNCYRTSTQTVPQKV